jgi:Fe-S-cluster-containing dehydrogenase component/CRP-like cAMP-binding protein/thioredoxin reductase
MSHLSDTIHGYQKHKHVMAAPHALPMRSDLRFDAGAREDVLDAWGEDVAGAAVNVRLDSEVASIAGARGGFVLRLACGETVRAAHIVLASGTHGNPRRLAIPGGDHPAVQYSLRDAAEYSGESIVVIGAGDAAIEVAIALAEANSVVLVNRGAGFAKAKPANVARIAAAIAAGRVCALEHAVPRRFEDGRLAVETPEGAQEIPCDRIIARLGTAPPNEFLKSCGLDVPGGGFPSLSDTYESAIPGLYIIGALAGYPLIKHGLKQGYEVVEYIIGNRPPPADEPLLKAKLGEAGLALSVADFVAYLRKRVALFAPLPERLIREFLLHARLRPVRGAETIFPENECSDQLYWVLEGEVALATRVPRPERICCGPGEIFGVLEFVSGRPRTGSAAATRLSLVLEADRPAMSILYRSAPSIGAAIDTVAVARQIRLHLAPGLDDEAVAALVKGARIDRFKAGEALGREGDEDDPLFLVRRGSVTVARRLGGAETILAYLPAGSVIGESQWLARQPPATVRATTATEAIRIDGAALRAALDAHPSVRQRIAERVSGHLSGPVPDRKRGALVQFLLDQGIGEATDVLLIDEARCVGCNNCETACAETHDGLSALDRTAGPRHGSVHLPNACRHCEHPHCMSECPTDSLHRAIDGSVYIDDTCTGCGYCERNCPYGAIHMAAPPERKHNLLTWLLFGWGSGPGAEARAPTPGRAGKHAVKCDGCRGAEEPACVSACPTGAAMRVNPEGFIKATLAAR